jgi:formamidopyrimidine-DNA glycosylase
MPELPDITVYIEALERRVLGHSLNRVQIVSPFLLRTAVPPIQQLAGRKVLSIRRIGKRIAFCFEEDLWLVLHLMIAGRLHWIQSTSSLAPQVSVQGAEPASQRVAKTAKMGKKQAAFDFDSGALILTEAGTKHRASLHLVRGEAGLQELNRGGLEILDCSLASFTNALVLENHTLKRALTDPRLFSGIGNAYADEILHHAQLSPVTLTRKLSQPEIERLCQATGEILTTWIERLRGEAGNEFPQNVTAFRPEMAVHGKFGQPCPVCGSKIQRIRYADNETNYCPKCQTGGKLLADRSLSLLLKRDWPKTPEELEEMRAGPRPA